jgi:hypothetical protein
MKKWCKQHASAIYIGVLLFLGLVGFMVGFYFSQSLDPKLKPWGDFCVQMFGSIIAVALTAVFFSISDMRNSFAQVVVDLLGRGEIARHLTEKDKRQLAKRIMEARASDCQFDADITLFDHLDELTLDAINTIYLKNVQHRKSLQRIKGEPHKLRSEISMSYVICCPPNRESAIQHLIDHTIMWNAPMSIAPKSGEWVKTATIKIGDKTYGKDVLEIGTGEPKDGLVTCNCKLTKEVSIREPLEVSIKMTLVSSVLDPVDIKVASYPCSGFSVDLQFEPDLFYDAMFFGATIREKAKIERGSIDRRNNGITCRYNGWLLPGEGVISYYQTGCGGTDFKPADVENKAPAKEEKPGEGGQS